MANDYCTATEIKNAMSDVDWPANYDTILAGLATRASRMIDAYLKREPGAFYVSSDTTRYFRGSGCEELWIGELATAPTSVAVAETGTTTYTAWASTDYILNPYNYAEEGLPILMLEIDINGTKGYWAEYPRSVKIVGKFGWSTSVPDDIKEAAIIQVARWFKRGQQAFADTGAVIELGQLRYTKKLDPDVEQILSAPKYQRVTI